MRPSLSLTAALFLTCVSGQALACRVDPTPERSAQNLAAAELIFEGQVLDVTMPPPGAPHEPAFATIRVAKLYKGPPSEVISAAYALGTSGCGHVLHAGDLNTFVAKQVDGVWKLNPQKGSYIAETDLPPPVPFAVSASPQGYVSGENVHPLAPEESTRIFSTLPNAIMGCSGMVKLSAHKTFDNHYVNIGYAPANPLRIDGQTHNIFNISLPLTSDLNDFGPIVLTTDSGTYQSTACSPEAFEVFKSYLSYFKN